MRAIAILLLLAATACARRPAPAVMVESRYQADCVPQADEERICVLSPRFTVSLPRGYQTLCATPPDSIGACVLRDQRLIVPFPD